MLKKLKSILTLLLFSLLLCSCVQESDAKAETVPIAQPVAEAAPARTDVENNGGYYVRVGEKVYFRRYGADALPAAAVFGAFTETWNVDGESELMVFDLQTNQVTALYTEAGLGPLWYGDGGFYLHERINGEDRVYWYAADGSGAEPVCPGEPLGLTESGLLAVKEMNSDLDYRSAYRFYQNRQLLSETRIDFYPTTAGLTDQGLFLLGSALDDDRDTEYIWQISPEGTLLRLGALPDLGEEAMFYESSPDRFLDAGDRVIVGVGYYAGTGYFLNDYIFFEAEPGRENSLRALETELELSYELPHLALNADGTPAFLPALPNELRIDWETGNLERYDGSSWQIMTQSLCSRGPAGSGYRRLEQHLDYVDGAVYATLACAQSSPADSIGWRDAYALLDMLYCKTGPDGAVQELACVDHGAELYGFVWMLAGEDTLLWQQLSSSDGEGWFTSEPAYALPLSEQVFWLGGKEAVFSGTSGLLPSDYGADEANEYGYPAPETEPADSVCLTLDRDGHVRSVARKDPEALLQIEFDVPKETLSDAVETLALNRRGSDEDTPWFWAKLTALENGVRVRLERTPEEQSVFEEMAMQEGVFIVGGTLLDRELRQGESLAVRVSLPWHPELRVSVSKAGAWGSYCFGEDNYLHWETEDRIHPPLTLAAYPPPDTRDYTGKGLRSALSGSWIYYAPDSEKPAALLRFDEDGNLYAESAEFGFAFTVEAERLYAEEWEAPDLLCLRTEDREITQRYGFDAAGDYLVQFCRTDGEELLCLTQANNGDGLLTHFLSEAGGQDAFSFVLHRSSGTGATGVRQRFVSFPALIARRDPDRLWLCEAEVAEEAEEGYIVWHTRPGAPCLPYPIADPEAVRVLGDERYPMQIYYVTVNGDGAVERVESSAG